jgi:hypothetical protein
MPMMRFSEAELEAAKKLKEVRGIKIKGEEPDTSWVEDLAEEPELPTDDQTTAIFIQKRGGKEKDDGGS